MDRAVAVFLVAVGAGGGLWSCTVQPPAHPPALWKGCPQSRLAAMARAHYKRPRTRLYHLREVAKA